MAEIRTRKSKENPHYGFLVSWQPKEAKRSHVKRETQIGKDIRIASVRHGKKADSLAREQASGSAKKGIVRSLIRISLILILELVVYLAWKRFLS
jgi:hypothetical protein